MADVENDLKEGLEVTDREMFESATADDPVTEEVEPVADEPASPEPVAATEDGPARDDKGRFAAKAETKPEPVAEPAKPDAAPVAQPDNEATVPSWRLREVREAREAAERRATDLEARLSAQERQIAEWQRRSQPQAEPPDIFADPQGWQQTIHATQQQALAAQRYEFSEMLARQASGDERVNDAENWAKSNLGPAERARIGNARHPYAELIRVQDERKVLTEIGTDPSAYVQRKLDEALNDPAFLAKAIERVKTGQQQPTSQAKPVVQIPPSLSRATSAASPHEEAGDMSDRSLFAYATK